MTDLIPFVVIGLVNGAIFAIAAMGLTLTYKTTGVFNFAYGAIAAAAAYFFYELHDQHHVSGTVSAVVTLLVFGVIVGLIFERFGNLLSRVSPSLQIVGTVGIMVAVQALIVLRYGSAAVNFTNFLPTNSHKWHTAIVSDTQIIVVVLAVGLGLGLWLILRFTSFGTTTRAVVDTPELLALTGRSPGAIRRWSWMLGSGFAAASGVLTAATVGTLDPTLLTLLLVQAFGAAALGAFRSLGLTFVGGILIGLLAALSTDWLSNNQSLSGLPTSMPFLVLVAVLIFMPKRWLAPHRGARFRIAPRERSRPVPVRVGLVVAGAAIVIFAPQVLGSSRVPSLTQALALTALFLSLGVLVKLSGQISLCHYGLAAIGATSFSRFAADFHIPWLLALLLAGVVVVPVGALVAIPAIRLSGLFLALATFGFGLLLQQLAYPSFLMFGRGFDRPTPRPSWASGQLAYYYLVAAVVAVCCVIAVVVGRSRLGRLLRGMSGSPVAVTTNGASINVTKVLVFCVSAFLAGISGALMGPVTGTVNQTPFDPLNSLTLLTVLFLAGTGAVRYAFVGGVALSLIPSYITDAKYTYYLQVLFGVSAIVIAALSLRVQRGSSYQQAALAVLRRIIGRGEVTSATDDGGSPERAVEAQPSETTLTPVAASGATAGDTR